MEELRRAYIQILQKTTPNKAIQTTPAKLYSNTETIEPEPLGKNSNSNICLVATELS